MEISSFSKKWIRLVMFTGIVCCVLLIPPLFQQLFALTQLSLTEEKYLWFFSGFVLVVCCVVFFNTRTNNNISWSLLLFSGLLLLVTELAARAAIKVFASPNTIDQLIREAEMSYGLGLAYEGHPFTQFTGKKDVALKGTRSFGGLQPFNNFGFADIDFEYNKPQSVIRIACIGESTTADGYPIYLEQTLNKSRSELKTCYQTMCFAQPMWTTQHTLVSFVTSIVDFNPDYLIIHHGWNEAKVRNTEKGKFRNDYSHHFKSFEKPEPRDAKLIRMSVAYRLLKFSIDKTPQWMNMGNAIEKQTRTSTYSFSDSTELYPFKRNIETIILLAQARGIKVVLTTLPHSTDSAIEFFYSAPNIVQCNAITRQIAKEHLSDVLFVDLDSAITGKYNNLFTDLGHVEVEGLMLKANLIAPVIIQNAIEKENTFKHLSVDSCRREFESRSAKRLLSNREWRAKHAGLTESELSIVSQHEAAELFKTDSFLRLTQ